MLGHVLPDDFFCEEAGRRTAAAFGLWLFLPGSKGIGTDAMSGCHFAIGAIFKFCKDFFTDMGWIGHDFDVVTVFLLFNYIWQYPDGALLQIVGGDKLIIPFC